MSDYGDGYISFSIEVRVPYDQAYDFARALTGNDDDIILAAETAMRDRLGRSATDEVELWTIDHTGIIKAELAEWRPKR